MLDIDQSLYNLTLTEHSKFSVFVVKSLAPRPLPLLVYSTTCINKQKIPAFSSDLHATLIRVKRGLSDKKKYTGTCHCWNYSTN